MPPKLRKTLDADPFYHVCARVGINSHVCGGRVTWDHAIIVAGKQLQEGWAIVPLCEKAHGCGRWVDSDDRNPEISQWIALERASHTRLEALSRAIDYIQLRLYLRAKFGRYVPSIEALRGLDSFRINYYPARYPL